MTVQYDQRVFDGTHVCHYIQQFVYETESWTDREKCIEFYKRCDADQKLVLSSSGGFVHKNWEGLVCDLLNLYDYENSTFMKAGECWLETSLSLFLRTAQNFRAGTPHISLMAYTELMVTYGQQLCITKRINAWQSLLVFLYGINEDFYRFCFTRKLDLHSINQFNRDNYDGQFWTTMVSTSESICRGIASQRILRRSVDIALEDPHLGPITQGLIVTKKNPHHKPLNLVSSAKHAVMGSNIGSENWRRFVLYFAPDYIVQDYFLQCGKTVMEATDADLDKIFTILKHWSQPGVGGKECAELCLELMVGKGKSTALVSLIEQYQAKPHDRFAFKRLVYGFCSYCAYKSDPNPTEMWSAALAVLSPQPNFVIKAAVLTLKQLLKNHQISKKDTLHDPYPMLSEVWNLVERYVWPTEIEHNFIQLDRMKGLYQDLDLQQCRFCNSFEHTLADCQVLRKYHSVPILDYQKKASKSTDVNLYSEKFKKFLGDFFDVRTGFQQGEVNLEL